MFFIVDKKIFLKLFYILLVSMSSFSSDFEKLSDISNGNESPKKLTPHSSPKKKSPEKRGVFQRNTNQQNSCKKQIDVFGEQEFFTENSPYISPIKKYLDNSCSSSSSSNAKLTINHRTEVDDFDSDDTCFEASTNKPEQCVVPKVESISAVDTKIDVYLSMTTSPTRMPNLEYILDKFSGLLGSKEVVGFYVNIPENYRNQIRDENDQVPTYDEKILSKLQDKFCKQIVFNILKHDLGPISKILPTIKALKSLGKDRALVISIDDDQYYHPESILELIRHKKNLADYIFSFAGGPLEHYGLTQEKRLSFPGDCVVGSYSNQSVIVPEKFWQEIVKTKKDNCRTLQNSMAQINSKTTKENIAAGATPSNKSPKAERVKEELCKTELCVSSLENARELIHQGELFKFCRSSALLKKELSAASNKAFGMDVDVVEGQACIIYAVSDFDENDVFLLEQLSDKKLFGKDCHLSDDLVISFVLSLNGKNRIYLKKNDKLKPWYIECEKSHALITEGALTHGSGYSQQEVEAMGIKHDKNNDKIKYQRALETLSANLKKEGLFLSKNEMVENLKKNKQ